MHASIDLIGTTLDIENDHVSDKTKNSCHLCSCQFMIYLFDKNQELLNFAGPLIIAHNKDNNGKHRRNLREECAKQVREMNRPNKKSPIKIEGEQSINYEIITEFANAKKGMLLQVEI